MSLTGKQFSLIEKLFGPQHENVPQQGYMSTVLNDARNRTNINQIRGINQSGAVGSGIPKHVTNVAASVSDASVGSTSKVTLTFQRDSTDKTFSGVTVYAKGYQGNQSPTQVGFGADSPITLILNNTGESVSLILQATGNGGSAPLANAPSCGVRLPKNATGGFGTQTTTNITSTQVQAISGAAVGPRANLPATAGKSGSVYLCTDSDYSYFSDGTKWVAQLCGRQGLDPATMSSVVKKNTVTPSGSSSDTTKGGILFTTGSHSGDHLEGYVMPVTPSSTLSVAIGFNNGFRAYSPLISGSQTVPQAGLVIYNANTGKWVFLRFIGSGLLYSRYQDSTGWIANVGSSVAMNNPWPGKGIMGIAFDGTNWGFNVFTDNQMYYPDPSITANQSPSLSEALSTWIGTNYTHVGVAANLGAANIWFQFLNIVRP